MEDSINNDEAIADYFIVTDTIKENIATELQPVNGLSKHEQDDCQNMENPVQNQPSQQGEILPSQTSEEEHIPIPLEPMDVVHNESVSVLEETPSIAKVLSASQIDEMFEITERQINQIDINEENHEEPIDTNPQVNMEDMKAVQDELREVDILVCGSCHTVFHFVDEFNLHKPHCKRKSDFHGNIVETKPQVWAFLLWKNALSKVDKHGLPVEESSWKLYQKWCKMSENIRNAWVAAGETVMNFSTFGYTKSSEPVNKPFPKKMDLPKEDIDEVEEHKPVILKKLVQRDAAGDIKEIKPTAIKKKLNEDAESIRNQLEDGDNSQDREITSSFAGQEGQEDTLQEEEFVVEKIVSRRFNPRKKQYEYLLKWEGYPSEQNTWEPAENLETCQHLLKAFEESLAKQNLNKQKTLGYKQKVDQSNSSASSSFTSHGGRPIRYSKQKALSQVKQWCGSIKPDDAELELLKRKMPVTDSDDDEDPYSKKMKMDKGSDSEESLGASKILYTKNAGKSGIIRRPGRPPLKPKITNGTTESLAAVLGLDTGGDEAKSSAIDAINRGIVKKSTGMSPHNQQVLVANAKGVVKVDPSQVPNLSSGVYIMSNKAGIIKLDSVSPSKALSLKGVPQGGSVKQLGPSGSVTSTTSQSGVIVVNRENQATPRTGVMRRPAGRGRGVGRPPLQRGNPSFRGSPNPNTRLIHSGSRANFNVSPGIRPRPPPIKPSVNELLKKPEGERKILGPKIGRGGISRGAMRGGRGGTTLTTLEKPKDIEADNVFIDLPQEHSSDSDHGLPDLFPTGKVLLKAEGEKTPEPTPPQSPKPNSLEAAVSEMINVKEESRTATASFLSKISSSSSGKDPLVKKTLKPGSIGSMSVSPKKSFNEDSDNEVVTISGEDGMMYKVRKSELTNSLLVGEDGQQCVYVTTGEDGDEGTVLTLDSSYADTVAQLGHVNILEDEGENEGTQFFVKEGEGGELVSLEVEGSGGEAGGEEAQSQVVAQLVEASDPEPGGGPRRVVLLLPDGNLMMTEVDEEQYAALELDK